VSVTQSNSLYKPYDAIHKKHILCIPADVYTILMMTHSPNGRFRHANIIYINIDDSVSTDELFNREIRIPGFMQI
jgi:hypothetical protein